MHRHAADGTSASSSHYAVAFSAGAEKPAITGPLILDSGTNMHMCGDLDQTSHPTRVHETVRVVNDHEARLTHEGAIGSLAGAKVLPGGGNLISIGKICDELRPSNVDSPGEPGVLFLRDKVIHGKFVPPPGARTIGHRGIGTNGLHHCIPTAFHSSPAAAANLSDFSHAEGVQLDPS